MADTAFQGALELGTRVKSSFVITQQYTHRLTEAESQPETGMDAASESNLSIKSLE